MEEQEEELWPWIQKPFVEVVKSIRQVKAQYLAMEDELLEIERELGTELLKSLEQIRRHPKVQEMEDSRPG